MSEAFEIVIRETPEGWDSDDVAWFSGGKKIGAGYKSKRDGSLHVLRCPQCSRENYALQAAVGSCAWCGFQP
jgi:ribosomal protein L37E